MPSLYESAWHIPATPWLANAAFLLILGMSRGPRRGLFALLAIAIALDAWLNGALTPLGRASPSVRTAVSLFFVLAGDFRYFAVSDLVAGDKGRSLARALGLAFVVPVVALPLRLLDAPERVLWLAYEGAFVVFALVLRAVLWPRWLGARSAPPEAVRAVRALTTFQIVQYGLWALADVLLLADLGVGWLLRLVPNTLYYAVFVPFAWWWTAEARPR